MEQYIRSISIGFIFLAMYLPNMAFGQLTHNTESEEQFENAKIDTIYDPPYVREPMSVEQYQRYIHEYKSRYSNLMVKEIHSPLSISKEYLERYMGKFRQRVDSMKPSFIENKSFMHMLKTDQIKTQADLDLCTFDIIPIYRLTANIMDINNYEEQQFADYFTLDTSEFVIMIRKQEIILDFLTGKPPYYQFVNAGGNGDTKNMVELGIKEGGNIFGINSPTSGSIYSRYAYVKNGRMYFASPIGYVYTKNEAGEKIGLHWLYEYVDNERAFDFGAYATAWLENYFSFVEATREYEKKYPPLNLNPQVIIYPQKD